MALSAIRLRSVVQLRVDAATFAIFIIGLSACYGSDAVANNHQKSSRDSSNSVVEQSSDTHQSEVKARLVLGSKHCGITETERSACMIEIIIADIRANHKNPGGGIASIKAGVGDSYSVALPQEERTDIFTYEFEIRGKKIMLKSKRESTESH